MEFRTYFAYFHTFSYKIKVLRTPSEPGRPVLKEAYSRQLLITKGPVIIYVEGGGGGVKAMSDWLEGGLKFFIKKFRRGQQFDRQVYFNSGPLAMMGKAVKLNLIYNLLQFNGNKVSDGHNNNKKGHKEDF